MSIVFASVALERDRPRETCVLVVGPGDRWRYRSREAVANLEHRDPFGRSDRGSCSMGGFIGPAALSGSPETAVEFGSAS